MAPRSITSRAPREGKPKSCETHLQVRCVSESLAFVA